MSQEMIQNLQGAVAMLLQGMIGIFVVLGIIALLSLNNLKKERGDME